MIGIGLIGRKVGMTRIFTEDGTVLPVTVIDVNGNVVVQKRTRAADSYTAVQVGFDEKPERVTNRPDAGHFAKAGVSPKRILKEFRIAEDDLANYEVGQTIEASLFKAGDVVDIIGKTKGRGFAGVMKRYNFKGAKASHGVHEYFRHGGSLGQNLSPGRVFRGHKMPGHYGDHRITVQNVRIAQVREEDGAILIHGQVPGAKNSYIVINKAVKYHGAGE